MRIWRGKFAEAGTETEGAYGENEHQQLGIHKEHGAELSEVEKDRGLADIEDILGDDYNLGHLRELVEADRDGRCKIVPCKLGEPLYLIKNGSIEKNYGVQWHFTDHDSQTFGTLSLYGDFICPEDIGKTVFFNREAAEKALKGEAHESI